MSTSRFKKNSVPRSSPRNTSRLTGSPKALRELSPRRPLRTEKKDETSPSSGHTRDDGKKKKKKMRNKPKHSAGKMGLWIVLSLVFALLAIFAWCYVGQHFHQRKS